MANWIVTQISIQGRHRRREHCRPQRSLLLHRRRRADGGVLRAAVGKPGRLRTRSPPLTHPSKVTTPILISHADRDPRVPLATAQQFFRALQAQGKTAEMDIYPRGGHVFYEPQQEKAVMTRYFRVDVAVHHTLGRTVTGQRNQIFCRSTPSGDCFVQNATINLPSTNSSRLRPRMVRHTSAAALPAIRRREVPERSARRRY